MRSRLELRYVGSSPEDTSNIDLAVLGESIIGFSQLCKDFFELSNLDGELDVRVSGVRNGSIFFGVDVHLAKLALELLSRPDLIHFVQVARPELVSTLHEIFLKTKDIHLQVNELFDKFPADVLLGDYLIRSFLMAREAKKPKWADGMPKRYVSGWNKLIRRGRFKKVLKPFVEGAVSQVEFRNISSGVACPIAEDGFDEYLAEDEQILPALINGSTHILVGELLGMQSIRGDTLTFKVDFQGQTLSLVAYPQKDVPIEEYLQYYRRCCRLTVEIYRKSLFQKPKLILKSIALEQEPLALE